MDITKYFRAAKIKSQNWSIDSFKITCKILVAEIDESELDWEEGDEDWGAVCSNDMGIVGMVRVDMPLAILRKDLPRFEYLRTTLEGRGIVILGISNFDEQCYSIEPDARTEIFPVNRWSSAVDHSNFSIKDMWWTTI